MASDTPDSFQCGPFEVTRRPDASAFAEKLNRLREAVDSCRLQPGKGYDVSRSSNGTVLSIKTGNQSVSNVMLFPFQLTVRANPSKGAEHYEFYAVTGTVGDGTLKIKNIEAWVDFVAPARIYLEAAIKDLEIKTLEIKTQEISKPFARTEIKDGAQAFSRIALGIYHKKQDTDKTYQLVQNVKTDILPCLFAYNGFPAIILSQELFVPIDTLSDA